MIERLIHAWRVRQAVRQARVSAHHEAGHAVAACRVNRPIGRVSIVPSSKSGGRVTNVLSQTPDRDAARLGEFAQVEPNFARLMFRSLDDEHAAVVLAGGAAARRLGPTAWWQAWRGSRTDRGFVREIMRRRAASPASARARLRWLRIETRARVAQDHRAIEAVARALLSNGRGELSGNEVREIINASDGEAQRQAVARDSKKGEKLGGVLVH